MAKDVVTKEQAKPPVDMSAYEQYAGAGLDNISSEDKGLPFFEILQPLSPEVNDGVPGAVAGKIINKATKEIFDSLTFVPVCREHVYTEWVPRDKGGGLVAVHQLNSDIVKQARAKQRVGKFIMPNGNELIETFYLYGMAMIDGTPSPAVVAFTSTKISAYKTLTTRSDSLMFMSRDGRKLKYPWFAHQWVFKTEKKQKDKYTWWNWTVAFAGGNDRADEARLPPDHDAVRLGAEILEQQRNGMLKVNTEGLSNAEVGGGGSTGGGTGGEDDPPF